MALIQVEKFEDKALRLAKSLGRALQANALVKLNKGLVPKISLDFLSKQVPLLTQLMVVANLQGRIDAKKAARRADPSLKLALNPAGEGIVFEKTVDFMRKALGTDINLRDIEDKYNIVALRTLRNVSDNIEKDIRGTAYDLIQRGATVKEAKKVLGERFDALGLTPRNSFQLETIFRTASSVAYGAGSWAAYQDKDIQEILWGYTYSAVMDDRTRPNHAAANGTTLPADDEFWQRMWPPNGYNCRCEVIPLFNKETEVPASPDAFPDPGFGYNPGIVLQPSGITDKPLTPPVTPVPEPTPEKPPIDIYEPPVEPTPPPIDIFEPPPPAEPPPIDIFEPPPEPAPTPLPIPERVGISIEQIKEEFERNEFFVPTKEKQQDWLRLSDNGELTVDDLAEIQLVADNLSEQSGLEIQPDLIINTDPDLLTDWLYAGSSMSTTFPEIIEGVEVGTLPRAEFSGKPERSIPRGRAFKDQNRIELLAQKPDVAIYEMIDDIDNKWHPRIENRLKTAARATPIHELGHKIGDALGTAQDYDQWAHEWAQPINLQLVSDDLARYPVYALRNRGFESFKAELTSEAMVQIMLLNKNKWSLPALQFYKILKKRPWARKLNI